ncbi:MAG: Alpha-L-fucosidase, partial [Frondihabitans sp.]|nr:Alpha-L-fucosidase [Frondihabitans sp.]
MPSQRHRLTLTRPAETFHDSFLLGNGSLGASLRGGIASEHVDINLDTFWSGGPLTHDADRAARPQQWLEPLKEAIREHRWQDAETFATRLQSGRYSQSFEPLGAVTWTYAPEGPISDYERTLDLATARSDVNYVVGTQSVRVESFVSAVDSVIVLEV